MSKQVSIDKNAIRDTILYGSLTDAVKVMQTTIRNSKFVPLHYGMIKTIEENVNSLILSYRGSGKSLTCTVSLALVLVVRYPNIRLLITSRTDAQVTNFGGEIRETINNNVLFKELFGELNGLSVKRKWNEHEMTISTRTIIQQEPTISCFAIGNRLISKHFDVIIADDLVVLTDAYSPTEREKLVNTFDQSMMGTLVKTSPCPKVQEIVGKIIVIGTRYHKRDLYSNLMDRKKRDGTKIYKVFRVPCLYRVNGVLKTPFPYHLSLEQALDKQQEIGKRAFRMQFNNCDKESDTAYFMVEDIQYFDSYSYIDNYTVKVYLGNGDEVLCDRVYAGVDLASGLSDRNDFFAIATVAVDDRMNFYVLDVFQNKLEFTDQIDTIIKYNSRFNYMLMGIEANAYQKVLPATLINNTSVPVDPVTTSTKKELRAERFSPTVRNKKLYLNSQMPNIEEVVTELVEFPDFKHDDMFDAIELACTLAERENTNRPFIV